MTRRQLFIAFAIFGLVLVNLLADLGLLWLIEEIFHSSAWLDQIPIGVILGQLLLLALWFARSAFAATWQLRNEPTKMATTAMASGISRTMKRIFDRSKGQASAGHNERFARLDAHFHALVSLMYRASGDGALGTRALAVKE